VQKSPRFQVSGEKTCSPCPCGQTLVLREIAMDNRLRIVVFRRLVIAVMIFHGLDVLGGAGAQAPFRPTSTSQIMNMFHADLQASRADCKPLGSTTAIGFAAPST
jgi:hypothetical protein